MRSIRVAVGAFEARRIKSASVTIEPDPRKLRDFQSRNIDI